MGMIISASINLSKLDKSKIIDGEKGKYYNITLMVSDTKDKYGNDVSVSDPQTKEERTAKEGKNYLGNGRVVWTGESRQSAEPKEKPYPEYNDELGF